MTIFAGLACFIPAVDALIALFALLIDAPLGMDSLVFPSLALNVGIISPHLDSSFFLHRVGSHLVVGRLLEYLTVYCVR